MKITNTKTVLLVVVGLAALVCIFAVWELHSPAATSAPSTGTTYSPVNEKTALAQLQADLQDVTPHFVDSSDTTAQVLVPQDQKIKDDVATLLLAQAIAAQPGVSFGSVEQWDKSMWLDAIGKQYILASSLHSEDSSFDEIVDSQTGEVTPIPTGVRYYLAPGRNIALYITSQAIYTYSLDQASTTFVSDSQLSGTETYHDAEVQGLGITVNPQETHTKDSITISVFDSSKSVPDPNGVEDGVTMYAKVGQKTLSF